MKVINSTNNAFKSFHTQRQDIENKTEAKEEVLKKQKSKTANAVAIASLAGAIVPLAIYNAKNGKLDKFKDVFQKEGSNIKEKANAITGFIEVKNIKQIAISVTSSILAGLGAGFAVDKNKENRTKKVKEGIYGFLNCMVPMGIIAGTEHVAQKHNVETNILGKALMVAGGIVSGMFISNKLSNGVNKVLFGKEDNEAEKREMKLSDTIVHADDIIGVIAMSKVPFAKQMGKVIPLIYSHVGYETGTQENKTSI